MSGRSIYLRLHERAVLRNGPITVGDVAEVLVFPNEVEAAVREVEVERLPQATREVILSALQLVREVQKHFPDASIQVLGPAQTLVMSKRTSRSGPWLVAAFIWLLLFVGAATAMLNFHTDVNMGQVLRDMYRLLTGQTTMHPIWIEVPYSIGVGLGVLLFFGWLDPSRRGDPSPLELQVHAYQQMVDDYRKHEPGKGGG